MFCLCLEWEKMGKLSWAAITLPEQGRWKMEDIAKIAQELSEKNNHVRKSVKKLMELWAKKSECGERIRSTTIVEENEYCIYYLYAGKNEIRGVINCAYDYELYDYDKNDYFWDAMSMSSLRAFLRIFPKMMEEITGKMVKNNNENIEFLETMQKLLKGN